MGRNTKVPRRVSDELRDDRTNYIDKELESQKRSLIYSTDKINKIIDELNNGGDADMMPFFHGKIEWRNSDVAFEYTEDEWNELLNCVSDPVYFAETYAKFLTDKGRRVVKLRPYQKDIIHMVCDEVYDESLDIMKPAKLRCILLASRLTGKCVKLTQNFNISNNDYTNIIIDNKSKYSFMNFIKKILKKIKL